MNGETEAIVASVGIPRSSRRTSSAAADCISTPMAFVFFGLPGGRRAHRVARPIPR